MHKNSEHVSKGRQLLKDFMYYRPTLIDAVISFSEAKLIRTEQTVYFSKLMKTFAIFDLFQLSRKIPEFKELI